MTVLLDDLVPSSTPGLRRDDTRPAGLGKFCLFCWPVVVRLLVVSVSGMAIWRGVFKYRLVQGGLALDFIGTSFPFELLERCSLSAPARNRVWPWKCGSGSVPTVRNRPWGRVERAEGSKHEMLMRERSRRPVGCSKLGACPGSEDESIARKIFALQTKELAWNQQ